VTRLVGGSAGGRRLAVPPGSLTRPTSDRAREGLFSTLSTVVDLTGARVADLYAGSGAVGLEALSRGASAALLVEADPKAVRVLRANVRELGLPGAAVLADRVERVVANPPADALPYDVVFADPPYLLDDAAVGQVLAALVEQHWLADGAVVVVERASRRPPLTWPNGLIADKARRYGEATLWYGRRS